MKKITGWVAMVIIVLAGCKPPVNKQMTESEKHVRADSIFGTRIQDLSMQAAEDLDRRKSIEVKAKADSIVQVYKQGLVSKIPAIKP